MLGMSLLLVAAPNLFRYQIIARQPSPVGRRGRDAEARLVPSAGNVQDGPPHVGHLANKPASQESRTCPLIVGS